MKSSFKRGTATLNTYEILVLLVGRLNCEVIYHVPIGELHVVHCTPDSQ